MMTTKDKMKTTTFTLLALTSVLISAVVGAELPSPTPPKTCSRVNQISPDKSLPLVEDGKSHARIVAGEDVSPSARFAASELQTYIRKATGAEVPIEKESKDDGMVEIIIGDGQIARKLGVSSDGLPRDGFRISTRGKRIVILGKDDPKKGVEEKDMINFGQWSSLYFEHGTINGAYDFLERFAGVRWYLPIDIGEVVPKTKTLNVPSIEIVDYPQKPCRFIHAQAGADEREDSPPIKAAEINTWPNFTGPKREAFNKQRYLFWLRLRHETRQSAGNHSMCYLISAERFAKSHPEYFALYPDGKRSFEVDRLPLGVHHCFSNDEMVKVLIEDAKAFFRGEPASSRGLPGWSAGLDLSLGKAFQIMQDDGFKPCSCEKCRAARTPGVEDMVRGQKLYLSYGEMMWSFVAKIANAVKDEFPGCFISTAAYGPMTNPPKTVKIPPNVIIRVAVSGPYSEIILGQAKVEEDKIMSWTRVAPAAGLTFWDYPLAGGWGGSDYISDQSICASIPRANAAYYQRYGNIGQGTYSYVCSHRFPYDHLSVYVFYKANWNPRLDIDQLLSEYYTLFYGPAAKPMGKFWDEVETQFRQAMKEAKDTPMGPMPDLKDKETLWDKIYGKETIDRWRGYFQEAEALTAKSDDPVYAKRVAYMKHNVLESIAEGHERYEKEKLSQGKKP